MFLERDGSGAAYLLPPTTHAKSPLLSYCRQTAAMGEYLTHITCLLCSLVRCFGLHYFCPDVLYGLLWTNKFEKIHEDLTLYVVWHQKIL